MRYPDSRGGPIRPRISAKELFGDSRAEAAVFDMDGVLSDTEGFHLLAWQRLVREHTGAEAPEDVVRATFGQTNDLIIPQLWAAVGKKPRGEELAGLGAEKEVLYREVARSRVRPVAGLERLMEWLRRQRIPTAIGTSGPEENVRFLLDEFGWRDRFDVVVDRSRFAAGKPAPDCFLKAAELLGTTPRRTIVFEDSQHGIASARRGGFLVCAIATTRPEAELRPHARWVFRDFRDIAC